MSETFILIIYQVSLQIGFRCENRLCHKFYDSILTVEDFYTAPSNFICLKYTEDRYKVKANATTSLTLTVEKRGGTIQADINMAADEDVEHSRMGS